MEDSRVEFSAKNTLENTRHHTRFLKIDFFKGGAEVAARWLANYGGGRSVGEPPHPENHRLKNSGRNNIVAAPFFCLVFLLKIDLFGVLWALLLTFHAPELLLFPIPVFLATKKPLSKSSFQKHDFASVSKLPSFSNPLFLLLLNQLRNWRFRKGHFREERKLVSLCRLDELQFFARPDGDAIPLEKDTPSFVSWRKCFAACVPILLDRVDSIWQVSR